MNRGTLTRRASSCIGVVALLSWSCTGPSPIEPEPAGVSVALSQNVDLAIGQTLQLRDTDVVATLIEARGPAQGCFDCPLRATLSARSGRETVELVYSFSGNMPEDLLAAARRKTALGYVFVAVRIADNSVTMRIERPSTSATQQTLDEMFTQRDQPCVVGCDEALALQEVLQRG